MVTGTWHQLIPLMLSTRLTPRLLAPVAATKFFRTAWDKAKLSFIVKSAAVYAPDADIDIRETRRLGDINNDGKRNAGDIAKIAAHVKGVKTLSAEDKEFADLNKDGKVNSADIVTLAAGIKGLKHLD